MKSIIPKEITSLSTEQQEKIEQYINERAMQSARETYDKMAADLVGMCLNTAVQILINDFAFGTHERKAKDHKLRIDKFKDEFIDKISKMS